MILRRYPPLHKTQHSGRTRSEQHGNLRLPRTPRCSCVRSHQRFDGALVTGAQINADGTARMDFDLPDADNDELRKLEPRVNDIISAGVAVRTSYVSHAEALATSGLIRSLSVAPPPTPDGRIRIVEIVGIDRQACGGTHLTNTSESLPVRITKVENKGRRNRRVKLAIDSK